mmetsp:Transcript_36272/g.104337  ORF Transcript_36272/g.104337 Transcript_36272/m.104337 type:complete len:202 (+) Transcript_36272:384-989(+)
MGCKLLCPHLVAALLDLLLHACVPLRIYPCLLGKLPFAHLLPVMSLVLHGGTLVLLPLGCDLGFACLVPDVGLVGGLHRLHAGTLLLQRVHIGLFPPLGVQAVPELHGLGLLGPGHLHPRHLMLISLHPCQFRPLPVGLEALGAPCGARPRFRPRQLGGGPRELCARVVQDVPDARRAEAGGVRRRGLVQRLHSATARPAA